GSSPVIGTRDGNTRAGAEIEAETEKDGTFRLDGAVEGETYRLEIESPEGERARLEGIKPVSGANPARMAIRFERTAASVGRLEGRIVDEAGSPVPGALVRV